MKLPRKIHNDESQPYQGANKRYENTPIQIYRKLHLQRLYIFRSAQNIDYGYSLEPLGEAILTSTHNLFLSRNKKNNIYPVNPSFTI